MAERKDVAGLLWVGDCGVPDEVECSRQQHRNDRDGEQRRVELCYTYRQSSRAACIASYREQKEEEIV